MISPYLPPVMSDVICDLSHYNMIDGDFSQTANAADANGNTIAAVILKATQGTSFVDPTFLERAAAAKSAGLLVGAYHFLDGSDAAAQAAHFLTVALSEAQITCLALDWEPNPASQANAMQVASVALSVASANDTWPIIYTIRSMLSAPNWTLSRCPLWLAEYGTRPILPPGFAEWKLWQHTDGQVGSDPVPVPGIGSCDRSRFAGSVDELKAWWATA